ncbi:MAG: radical SAM family heme chaperone HemW [Acidimicrobiia bacterium]
MSDVASDLSGPPDSPALADVAHSWKSAYIHIPFCARRCPYCDFAIVDESNEDVSHDRYVAALCDEIAMEDGIGELHAVNFGGGTPSRVKPELLGHVTEALRSRFGLRDDAEVSLEINPEDWSPQLGADLVGVGFTRVSIGAQSMDDNVLGHLGRLHNAAMVSDAVDGARQAGFTTISVDAIIGHPSETEASWTATAARVLDLPVNHLSTYALTVEPGTQLSREVGDGAPGPDDDVQADRYELLDAMAADAGFGRYEVSNFARDGHACRYNLSTWAHGEYVAFGLGAHDHHWGTRSRNHRRIDRYLADVERGVRPRLGSEELTPLEQERDRFMLGLRLGAGTARTETAERFLESDAGRRFVDAEVLVVTDDRVRVANLLLADAVAREALSVSMPDC